MDAAHPSLRSLSDWREDHDHRRATLVLRQYGRLWRASFLSARGMKPAGRRVPGIAMTQVEDDVADEAGHAPAAKASQIQLARQPSRAPSRSWMERKEVAMQLQHDGFIVIADGEKMLLLRNRGDAEFPHLELIEQDERQSRANRDLRRDVPGRSFSSVGPGRSAYDEADSR